ncbi:Urb2/Npa2 family-domain-containing protein [Lophiotrema nucula]|uniref:Urb2/Npa2 family-domain-containing protein n=1 Tax=Lophiotrema nucula TaxID=690887 RepID=A0A6A5YXG9_9PLEO|nr:Urb2/Npa2 family-domain-containing protein [Lophiotrema nucula]
MAQVAVAPMATPAPTLPRLLAVNKDFTSLDEQIRQATHIIGLPDGWEILREGKERSDISRRIVRARAEWALRWILEKLRDETEAGTQARANEACWNLLDWMLHIVPTSRAATQLRDADFTSILEKTLQENSEREVAVGAQRGERVNDISESSETAREEPSPSRKRKRPSSGSSTPSKRQALDGPITATQGPLQLSNLFGAITSVTKTLTERADNTSADGAIQAEHIRMALRTDSAQAARILKSWLTAVHKLLLTQLGSASKGLRSRVLSSLPYVLQIWNLRNIDADDDTGASAEQFSTECLIAALTLHDTLRTLDAEDPDPAVDGVIQSMERLLASHLLAPSRSAFFATAAKTEKNDEAVDATMFAEYLLPLRAKIEQAAEIQDASEPLPTFFKPLFRAIPYLLDLTIKCFPSRTHKSRATGGTWIQGVFVSLAECAGCPLEEPKHAVHKSSIEIVEHLINTLATYSLTVHPKILQKYFWFHSGVKSLSKQEQAINWSLIAALIKLDANLFLTQPKSASSTTAELPDDMAQILFDQISSRPAEDVIPGRSSVTSPDFMQRASSSGLQQEHTATINSTMTTVVETIIMPILTAFARNRDLLGYIHRWDAQLCGSSPTRRTPFKTLSQSVWRDRKLMLAFKAVFENSLTSHQIVNLFKVHVGRIGTEIPHAPEELTTFFAGAYSSTVIINAIIESLEDDETIENLREHLRSALQNYAISVQDKQYRSNSDIELLWMTISQLLVIMWPVDLQMSRPRQEDFLRPLVEQAMEDVSTGRKQKDGERIDSKGRAGAFMFLLTACDHLRSVEGWDELVQRSLRKILKALSTSRLEATDLSSMAEILCAEFPHLLEYLETGSREGTLLDLLSKIAKHTSAEIAPQIATALSQHFFTKASPDLRNAYSSALLATVDKMGENDDLVATTMDALLQVVPAAISRSQREAILDNITDKLRSNPHNVEPYLSIMNHLMQVSNSTAKISSNGKTLFAISQSLHDAKLESVSTLEGFQELVRLTLHYLLLNRDQKQNKDYLTVFGAKLDAVLEKPRKCTSEKLAVLRATIMVQKDAAVVDWSQYLRLLDYCLQGKILPADLILDALNDFRPEFLNDHPDILGEVGGLIRKWINLQSGLNDVLSSPWNDGLSSLPLPTWIRLQKVLARYRLYRDIEWFLELSAQLLKAEVVPQDIHDILESVSDAISSLSLSERLQLLPFLAKEGDQPEALRLLHIVVSKLEDGQAHDGEQTQQQLVLVPRICALLGKSPSTEVFNTLLDSLDTIMNEKPWLLSQNNIEVVLATLVGLTSRSAPSFPSASAPKIYTRLCHTSRLILKLYRGRLGGRFHLLLPLLQNLLLCLFIPNNNRGNALPPWLKPTTATLTPTNATQYTRLLSTLCSPTLSSISKSHHRRTANTRDSLNDPIKAARDYVAQHIYPLLSSFSRFQLNGRLDPQVRDKLMPGIWEVVGIASLNREGLDAMFAGMDKSSQGVWRGVWEEWRRVHRRGKERERKS